MDLVANPAATKVVVVMEHMSKGQHKILRDCTFPLTGAKCVSRIITELCVFDCHPQEGLTLVEIAPEVTVEQVEAATEASFKISPELKTIDV